MNKWNGIGRLTSKPELRYTNSNIGYSRFTIAVNRPKQKEKEQETDFIDCVAWRGQAENLCNYQDKGNLIAVEGSLRKESYQDKDGNKRKGFDIVADNVHFAEPKRDSYKDSFEGRDIPPAREESEIPYSNGDVSDFEVTVSDDDLPF